MLSRKHIIKSIIIIVLVLVGFISYEEEAINPTGSSIIPKAKVEVVQKSLDREVIPSTLLTLNTKAQSGFAKGDIKANLFGKFFYDRAEFYIIKNPQNKIYSSQTESVTLFYLDGELCQTKYLLENDIVSSLLKEYGSFKIKGFDIKNRELISSENSIIKKEGKKIIMNKKLDNYLLEWSLGNKEIMYRVNTAKENKSFEYLEKVKNYEQEYLAIEKNIF